MINWHDADNASKNLQFEGKRGHLVTITSTAEYQFLIDTFGAELKDRWIGAYQVDGSQEPNDGWAWVTGESWAYSRWGETEPNNAGGNEDAIILTDAYDWNDKDASDNAYWIPGYIIEYGPSDINDSVYFDPISSSYSFSTDTTGCPSSFTGKFKFAATLTNISGMYLTDLIVEISNLTNANLIMDGNRLLGVGEWFRVKEKDEYNGVLGRDLLSARGHHVDVPFTVCTKYKRPFQLYVNVLGEPITSAAEFVEYSIGSVASSDFHDGHPPEHTIDGDLDTGWAAMGDGQWVEFHLTNVSSIGAVKVAWGKGDLRKASFDILVHWEDIYEGKHYWYTVFSGQSSGTTLNLEEYDISDRSGDRVRIVGHGNSEDMWNIIDEVEICGVERTMKIPINGVSVSSEEDGYLPENMIDGNFGSSWAATTDGDVSWCWLWAAPDPESFSPRWAELNLGFMARVRSVKIAWLNGDSRSTSFDIWIKDGFRECVRVYRGQSSGTTSGSKHTRCLKHGVRVPLSL